MPSYFTKYGGTVISAAIDKYSYVVVEQIGQGPSQVEGNSEYGLASSRQDQPMRQVHSRVQQAVLDHFGLTNGLSIFISSQLPDAAGVGSSTAEAMALVKAMSEVSGKPLDARALAELAGRLEIDDLQLPWGLQDHYSIAFGGLNCLTFETGHVEVTPIPLAASALAELENRLMLFFTGRPSNWWDLLNERKRMTEGNRSRAVQALHASKAAAVGLSNDLCCGEIGTVGYWLEQGWLAKQSFGDRVSDGWIDRWYEVARKAGATGGEIVGPGGGGFMLLYAEPDRQAAITAELTAAGLTRTRFHFETNGAAVLANHLATTGLMRKASGSR
jgi:D-glycero-alpha-D-manno-heptose-7-phosphate kinase